MIRSAVLGLLLLASNAAVHANDSSPSERLVHRFLRVEISPNAAYVASVEGDAPVGGSFPPVRDLIVRHIKTGAATAISLPCGRVPQCWPDSPAWTPDGSRLSFTLRAPGSHARSVYSVAPDGSGLTRLLDYGGTIEELRYSPGGRLAMLATANSVKEVGATEAGAPVAGDLDAPSPEQRIAVLEGGVLKFASPPELFVYEYDWRPDGSGFVGTAAPGNGDDNWWIAKLYAFSLPAAQARVIYAPVDVRQQLASPKVSKDGRSVAFIAGIMSDFGSTGGDVYTVPIDGGSAVAVTPGMRASATSIAWRCDGHLQAQLLAGDQTQFVELGDGRKAAAARLLWSTSDSVGLRSGKVSTACPAGVIAAERESFTAPPEIAVGPMGHWRDLTRVNAGMSAKAHVQSLSWKSDGFDVQGWLLSPLHADRPMPMITMVHGGPAAAWVPGFSGPGLSETLLERGYAIFRPNPRGSFGQGERFTAANVRDFGYGDLRDILAGIDAASKAAPIDDTRLGITGGSYGGFMTMWAVTQTQRFKAAVAGAGISNWLSYYGENGIDGWMLPFFGASAYEDPAVYARSSPIHFIRNVRTPTFAYAGELDIECPPAQTQEFWHALKTLGVPTSVMIYPGEGHGLRDPKHSADLLERTVAWFDRYLNMSSQLAN